MKISDTTIYTLTRNYATEEVEDGTVNSITFSLGGLYKFARQLITLSQEVEPSLVERIRALPRVYNPSAVSIDDVIALIEGANERT